MIKKLRKKKVYNLLKKKFNQKKIILVTTTNKIIITIINKHVLGSQDRNLNQIYCNKVVCRELEI